MADQIPFQEGIDFLQGKVNLPTRKSSDLKHAAQVRGFSVAGVTRDDMLADFRAAIEKARAQGTGFNEFRKDFDEIVNRTGWKFFSHGKTEEERRAWRARIIYTTNMRTSYMAGRYAQLTDPDVLRYRPYWRYLHSGARHPRKLHLSWNGMVWRADDPCWDRIYPPNGWGCGCDVEALSERQLKALGKTGPDPSPDLKPYEDTDPRTGQAETRIPGIDRGWEYNVGKEWLEGVVPTELRKPLPAYGDMPAVENLPPLPAPTRVRQSEILETGLDQGEYTKAFFEPFNVKPDGIGLYRDVTGGIIPISRSLFGGSLDGSLGPDGFGPYSKVIADTVISPHEIWASWAALDTAPRLSRTYIRQILIGRSTTPQLVQVQWTSIGWFATVTALTDKLLSSLRFGALLYRKREG